MHKGLGLGTYVFGLGLKISASTISLVRDDADQVKNCGGENLFPRCHDEVGCHAFRKQFVTYA